MNNSKNIPELSHRPNLDPTKVRVHLDKKNWHQMNHAPYMHPSFEGNQRFLLLLFIIRCYCTTKSYWIVELFPEKLIKSLILVLTQISELWRKTLEGNVPCVFNANSIKNLFIFLIRPTNKLGSWLGTFFSFSSFLLMD